MAKIISVEGLTIRSRPHARGEDYLSLTDLAKREKADPDVTIGNWLRNRDTIEFLGVWETIHNPLFNPLNFEGFMSQAGSGRFSLSVKQWAAETGAIGIQSQQGRGGGTFAHPDIALAFCSWLSPAFQLYVIQEFKRLKEVEEKSVDWVTNRLFSKVNYRLHTDAVQHFLLQERTTRTEKNLTFASEADLLNTVLWGITAREWQAQNPEKKGNMRDHASTEHLLVLANLENLNAELIAQGKTQTERLERLQDIAQYQLQIIYALYKK